MLLGNIEAIEFFGQIDKQIAEQEAREQKEKDKKAVRDRIKRDTEEDTNILDYCREHHLDNRTAEEIRDTKIIFEEADKLDINNPIECMLYNQMLAGLDNNY